MASVVLPSTYGLTSRCVSRQQISVSARPLVKQSLRTQPVRTVTAAASSGGRGENGSFSDAPGRDMGSAISGASPEKSTSRARPASAVSGAAEGAAAATTKSTRVEVPTETDQRGLTRMVLQEEGYEQWEWQGNKVNYVVAGDVSSDATPLLLIHGFGASVYHWRYNIPALAAAGRPVYAIDLIGFGWSDRALIQYSAAMWADQVSSFIRDVIGRPAVLVGNSVGGYVTLTTAATHPDAVAGTVLVNAAGKFEESPPGTAPLSGADESPRSSSARKTAAVLPVEVHGHPHGQAEKVPLLVVVREKAEEVWEGVVAGVGKVVRRAVLHVTFLQAKQPGRIKQVLELVYPNPESVDDELVRSIVLPTRDPNAAEVYYRLSTQVLLHPSALSLNALLTSLRESKTPTLLLWGALDPWMTPAKAQTIVDNYPSVQRVDISAGHCPHDEDPDAFNRALLQWMQANF